MAYTQSERMCHILSPLDDGALLWRDMNMREAISELFECHLDLLSEDDELEFDLSFSTSAGSRSPARWSR
jgi:uncharacterized protein involved in type VI secretion and phage assembly